jgi:ferredoxin
MKYQSTPESARFKQARHRCNECRRIFDCQPCHHRGRNLPKIFCSEACEMKALEARFDRTVATDSNVFTRYLKRAGLSVK